MQRVNKIYARPQVNKRPKKPNKRLATAQKQTASHVALWDIGIPTTRFHPTVPTPTMVGEPKRTQLNAPDKTARVKPTAALNNSHLAFL